MLVVVFDNETKAYEGDKALLQLDREGSLTVYAHAVLAKKADGTAVVLQSGDSGPVGSVLGATWGALIGLLGGPVGVAVGAGAGLVAGSAADLAQLRLGADFIEEVTKLLVPDRVAVVAEIDENWTTPVDTRMEAIGGTVVRRSLSEVQDKIDEQHVAAMKADLAQMKAEHAKAHADRKARIQDKINQLETKLQAQLQKSKEKREAVERETKAKLKALKAKAAAGNAKSK
jgi:uncharacterized membrane protein